ncbi:MAG: hypothetical protein ABGY95_03885 [Rubritalea sp.]|uniref:hypothetical protein n=1 Tax=Rubritalea sp. TaxID=2109375 RepID=UPI0032428B34
MRQFREVKRFGSLGMLAMNPVDTAFRDGKTEENAEKYKVEREWFLSVGMFCSLVARI